MSDMKFTKEQQAAIDARDKNVLVSAAAGSGKTAVLSERIIKMLLPEDGKKPVDADKLLVVTFTRAAASEMKERIERGLKNEENLAASSSDIKRKKLISSQIKKLSSAKITTIDSFCQSLVKEYFHILDIDPSFTVIEESESIAINEEVFEGLVSDLYKNQDNEFLKIVKNYCQNGSEIQLKNMVFAIYDFTSSFPYPEKYINEMCEEYACRNGIENTVWFSKINEKFKRDARKISGIYETAIKNTPQDETWQGVVAFLEDEKSRADAIIGMGIDDAVSYITEFDFKRFNMPKNCNSDISAAIKKLRDKAKDAIRDLPDIVSGDIKITEKFLKEKIYPSAKAITGITLEFIERLDECKRKRSVLDFSDIERMAFRLLDKHPDVRKAQKKRYSEILIDEYQDTNSLQDGLFSMLSNGKNLFMVGDMKQSIYRFRKSDPIVFRNKSDSYEMSEDAPERKIILSSNFRSRDEVLSAVNDVFETVMSRDVGELDYDDEQKLYTGNKDYDAGDGEYQAECVVIASNDEKTDSEKRIEEEALYIAQRIVQMKRSGFLVYDNDTKCKRPITNSDIAILMSSHKAAFPIYKKIFEKYHIDFSCESVGFFSTPEIKLMMALLRTIENPERDVPLVAVMRSAIGGFLDDEIALLRACYPGKSFNKCIFNAYSDYLSSKDELSENSAAFGKKLAVFCERLLKWRDAARYMSADRIVRMLYENAGLYAFFSAAAGEEAVANLRLFFDRARKCEKNGFSGLYKFLRQMEKLEKNDKDLSGAQAFSSNECVRIMTIHKSKGLEMPVVFVAGCSREFNLMSANGRVLFHPVLGFSLDYVNYSEGIEIKSPIHDVISDEIKIEAKSEEMRKLYVAMTRAREKLIVTASYGEAAVENANKWQNMTIEEIKEKTSYAECFADWVAPVAANSDNWKFTVARDNKEEAAREAVVGNEENIHVDAISILEYRYPFETGDVKSKAAVSDFKGVSNEVNDLKRKPAFLMQEKSSGAEYGTAVHKILETIPHSIALDVDAIEKHIKALSEAGTLDEMLAKSIRPEIIAGFFGSDIGKRILKADKVMKESEFEISADASELYQDSALKGEKILLQGVVDCWFVENDEIVIVDYKTDKVKEIDEIHQKYDIQLELYAKALEKITKKRVKEKFIYLFSKETVVQC